MAADIQHYKTLVAIDGMNNPAWFLHLWEHIH